jgi:hypothetical protein
LTFDHFGTRGVRPTLLAVSDAMPSTALPNRLIMNVTDPRQCVMTCSRRSAPTCRRMMSIAGG